MNTKLKKLRNKAKLSQKELAVLAFESGCQSRISHYERGSRSPTLKDAKSILKALSNLGVKAKLEDLLVDD